MPATKFPLTLPHPIPGTVDQVFPDAYCPGPSFFAIDKAGGHARVVYPIYANKAAYDAGKQSIGDYAMPIQSPEPEMSADGEPLFAGDPTKDVANVTPPQKQNPTKRYTADGREKEVAQPAKPGFNEFKQLVDASLKALEKEIDKLVVKRSEFKSAKDVV